MGNTSSFCFQNDSLYSFTYSDSLPAELTKYQAILFFSGIKSSINDTELGNVLEYLSDNNGIYIGSEEWPLQAESRKFNQQLYNKENYGLYTEENARPADLQGHPSLEKLDSIPAGRTTVAFPLDYRLKVEAWIGDQPLILSGFYGDGRIILDGGYSRYYCTVFSDCSKQMFYQFLEFLTKKDN